MPDQSGAGEEPGDAGEGPGDAGSGGVAGAAVGGGMNAAGAAGAGNPAAHSPLDLKFDGRFVRKVAPRADGSLLVLLEKALDLRVDYVHPQRELRLFGPDGQLIASITASSPTRYLLDFAVHDSGDISVLYVSPTEYSLGRFDAQGKSVAESVIDDAKIDQDPPAWTGNQPSARVESITRDTGRIAAFGEQLVVATRTGRHSVLAYRFGFSQDGVGAGYRAEWRTLVVPPFGMGSIGLKDGGSYDTFSAIQGPAMVHLAVDAAGTIYVGVQHSSTGDTQMLKAHQRVFGETLVGDPDALDVYITRLASNGVRLGTTVVGTPEDDQMFGLRGGVDSAWVIGRKEYWNEQGTGFDALVAQLDGKTGAVAVRELDVHLSDIAFDAAPLAGGTWLVAGAADWVQNPNGASISEHSQAFVHRVAADGSSVPIDLGDGARHNEARSLIALSADRWLVGGMRDGPGTHSGDSDASLVRASGFLREVSLGDE